MGSKPKGASGISTGGTTGTTAAATPDPRLAEQATLAGQIGGPAATATALPSTGGLALPPAAAGMLPGAGLNWTMPAAAPAPTRATLAQAILPHGGGSGQQRGNIAYGGGNVPGGFAGGILTGRGNR